MIQIHETMRRKEGRKRGGRGRMLYKRQKSHYRAVYTMMRHFSFISPCILSFISPYSKGSTGLICTKTMEN